MMQYPITLPIDYGMGIIRRRVQTRGSALDDRAGLLCKVYGIREVGVASSPVNQYAPFYLWHDVTAATAFLWRGQGFDGIVRDFGRPRVHTWLPCAYTRGAAAPSSVAQAVVRTCRIEPDADLTDIAELLSDQVAERSRHPATHVAAAGIDPTNWRTAEITTRNGGPALEGTSYTVLHISQPAHEQPQPPGAR